MWVSEILYISGHREDITFGNEDNAFEFYKRFKRNVLNEFECVELGADSKCINTKLIIYVKEPIYEKVDI